MRVTAYIFKTNGQSRPRWKNYLSGFRAGSDENKSSIGPIVAEQNEGRKLGLREGQAPCLF